MKTFTMKNYDRNPSFCENKKNWVKVLVGDKKFGKKALSGDEISGNFFDRGGIPLIPR